MIKRDGTMASGAGTRVGEPGPGPGRPQKPLAAQERHHCSRDATGMRRSNEPCVLGIYPMGGAEPCLCKEPLTFALPAMLTLNTTAI